MRRCNDEQRKPKFDKNAWMTPPEVFRPLESLFHFGLDAAAVEENAQVDSWFDPNGLHRRRKGKSPSYIPIDGGALGSLPWAEASKGKPVWLNPPHSGPLLKQFIERAKITANFVPVVLLLPGTIDTRWFHGLARLEGLDTQFVFIQGRVRFLNPETKGPLATKQVGDLIVVLGDPEHRIYNLGDFLPPALSWDPN